MKIEIQYNKDIEIPQWMDQELKGNSLLGKILIQRGIDTLEKLKTFLNPNLYYPTDPADFPDMEKAVRLILQAVDSGLKICVYGDYDVDGVTSTAILVEILRKIGARVTYHVPNRFTEGYGMNKEVIKNLAHDGVEFIITCDCGISNTEEILLAKSLGITIVITDHHHLPEELPTADAILSPKLLSEDHTAYNLPGAGMAYFLAVGILSILDRLPEGIELLDLVVLAVVADVVPLVGENRYLLQKGLSLLSKTRRPGLQELFKISGLNHREITEEEIGFQIAPRMNAAGRIASAKLAVELLLTTDSEVAVSLARELDQINSRRREIGDQMYEEAKTQLGIGFANRPIILYNPHWHEGVLGIVASKLCEEYYVPVLLMGLKEDKKTITGSARSIPGVHIYEALKKCAPILYKFGGHAGAAGFSLTHDRLTLFEKSIESVLLEELQKHGDGRIIQVDGVLPLQEITSKTYWELKKLAPFGEANPVPLFLCSGVKVVYHRVTGDNRHLRLILKQNATQYPAIWWWGGDSELTPEIDLVYSIGLNRWQGKEEIQLVVHQIINKEILDLRQLKEIENLELEIIDYRNWRELGRSLPDFSLPFYYFEGTDLPDFPGGLLINRYQMVQGETLVLLTAPPGLRVLKELVYAQRPRKVVLAYSKKDLTTGDIFVKKLIGLIKYIVEKKSGRTDIYQLATLTGEMENTVLVGLRYLKEKGFIEFAFVTPDSFYIRKVKKSTSGMVKSIEEKLRLLLLESRAFRKYMLTSHIDNLEKLITGKLQFP